MPIDFNAPANRLAYTGREADASWRDAMRRIVDPIDLDVADIGCGGGIYSRAWRALGARSVTGVDFSRELLGAARESSSGLRGVSFVEGDAAATGLPDECVDLVFERALLHHLQQVAPALLEARRILRPGGVLVIQDRTADDAFQPASVDHVRGYIFECFPRLLELELGRRPDPVMLLGELHSAGFVDTSMTKLWEVRAVHETREHLLDDIRSRRGRSILHELDDVELGRLVDFLRDRLPGGRLVERDRWTLWVATRATG
jgi:SAM-dependent methyltransferase